MVTWNRRYRSTEKGYSRIGAKREAQMIVAAEEEGADRRIASMRGLVTDRLNGGGIVYDSGNEEVVDPRLAAIHDVVATEPLEVDATDSKAEAIAAAKESIRERVSSYTRELEPTRGRATESERRIEVGVLTRAWRRVVALFQ